MNYACRICDKTSSQAVYHCREQMFGRGGDFLYFQCAQCGCLQINQPPVDPAQFYPADYYSYQLQAIPRSGWKAWLAARRDLAVVTNAGGPGRWIHHFMPAHSILTSLAQVPLERQMKILDVGCGSGWLLNYLHRAGFPYLAGIDPFIPHDLQLAPNVRVRKLSLDQIQEQYDLIMLHHVFEHIESGLPFLKSCRQRLTPAGQMLLRFPTTDSDAWEAYRENWVQLDAPRHFFLHSKASFALLAGQAGLKIEKWCCDSTAFQFWGSELYRRGLPLVDAQGSPVNFEKVFTPQEIKDFGEKANAANRNQRGDQVVVILSQARGGA
jgi:SAM-dependent methyltransferase